jgi:hypothetical protein
MDGIFQNFELFLYRKGCGLSPQAVDRGWLRSTVDLGPWHSGGSPEPGVPSLEMVRQGNRPAARRRCGILWSSMQRRFGHEEEELLVGMDAAWSGGAHGAFILVGARERRRSGSNRRWLGGASSCDSFGFDSTPRGRGNEGVEQGGRVDTLGRHCSDGWNRWQRRLDDQRRKTVGERAGIGPKVEWDGRAGPKRKLGQW